MMSRSIWAAAVWSLLLAGCTSGGARHDDVLVDICSSARLAGTSGYVAVVKTGACAHDASVLTIYNEVVSHTHSDARATFCGIESYQVFVVNGVPEAAFKIMTDGAVEKMSLHGIEPFHGGYVLWHDHTRRGTCFSCPRYVDYIRGVAGGRTGDGRSCFARAADAEAQY